VNDVRIQLVEQLPHVCEGVEITSGSDRTDQAFKLNEAGAIIRHLIIMRIELASVDKINIKKPPISYVYPAD
jgi:hypothetical protein